MESFNGGSDTHVSPRWDDSARPKDWMDRAYTSPRTLFCDTGMRAFYGVRPFFVFTNSQLTITV